MSMMNVSLPEKQIKEIDSVIDEYGYANRSEFVRSALRYVLRNKIATVDLVNFPFVIANPKDNPDEVVEEFRGIGKYNEAFLKDLEIGLKRSNIAKK